MINPANHQKHPVTFVKVTRLVLACREPFKSNALNLLPGQSLRLHREPSNPRDRQAIRVDTLEGLAVGYLDADTASYLSILMDHSALDDESTVASIQTAPPPDDPAARRLRYPRLFLHLRLQLPDAEPLLTITAVLGLKTEDYRQRFNLAGNPWLAPLCDLHEQYLRGGHDQFQMPTAFVQNWINLTGGRKKL